MTFSLEGTTTLPPQAPPAVATPLQVPEFEVDTSRLAGGAFEFETTCRSCHGPGAVAGGMAPDLRASGVVLSAQAFERVVRQGERTHRGMPPYAHLTDEQLESIRHYIRSRVEAPSPGAPAPGGGN